MAYSFTRLKAVLYMVVLVTLSHNAFAQVLSEPYLQSPSESSIWVCWKTNEGTESTVKYGTSANALTITASGTNNALTDVYNYHTVQLTELSANTTYYYSVKTGSVASKTYSFKTQPALNSKSGHFRILVWGDHQLINSSYENKWREDTLLARAKANVEKMYGTPIEQSLNLVLCDGDQVDAGTLAMYEGEHFRIGGMISPNVPIMTTVGNHETYSDPDMANYKAHFVYDNIAYKGISCPGNELYYSFQQANIVFIVLNTEDNSTEQLNWVKNVVTAANADPNVDWIISMAHRPYNCEQYVGDYSAWFRNSVMPVLGTSPKHALFISGHHHLYHRGQTKDWPTYHICDGGASWDQYWGQSTEQDMDDIQKTITNWAYQVIDFDLEKKDMQVKSYAIGHPLLGVVYDNKIIDEFHRKLDVAAPKTPTVTPVLTDTITLPYTFASSTYATTTNEVFNSTEFEISTSPNFATIEKDIVRDVENFYGDSGAPNYTPVNVNASVDILKLNIKANELLNGTHYIRTRHRDANVMWSEWSAAVPFIVKGSIDGNPGISIAKTIYKADEDVTVTYKYGTGNAKDWLGVYVKGQVPGDVNSTQWTYITDNAGSYSFKGLSPNVEYYIAYFSNDGYTEIAPRVSFYVGSSPTLSSAKLTIKANETFTLSYANAPGQEKDWIGVYKCGETPGAATTSKAWQYVTSANGTFDIKNLTKGYYYATYMVNDGYTEISNRLQFQVGDTIAQVSMNKNTFEPSEDFVVNFTDGPGGPKDYLGIFKKGDIPGTNPLITYKYVNGLSAGSVTITDDIPAGEYYIAMYPNDSYTQISQQFAFKVNGTTGINEVAKNDKGITIYPNPSNGLFDVTFKNINTTEKGSIVITNAAGIVCYRQNNITVNGTGSEKLNLNNHKSGMYTLTLIVSNTNYNQKLILLK